MKTKPKSKHQIFFVRFLVIYFLHLVIKWGDETFHGFFDFTFRGFLLSVLFISLWMSALYILDWIKYRHLIPEKITALLFFYIVFGYVFSLITNVMYKYIDNHFFEKDWGDIGYFNPTLTLPLTLIFVTNIGLYEYFKSDIRSKEAQIKTEQLQKENAIAHYKLLKSQIEPHFLFNSLSVLSSLVHKDAFLAEEFIVKLSKILRFAVEQTDVIYVSLQDEVDFMMNYFYLIKTRFQEGIFIENQLMINREEYILPPYTLQTLVENAIQHTSFSIDNPLNILIYNDDEFIFIENNFSPKTQNRNSTGIGLGNLTKRIKHISQNEMKYSIINGKFKVQIPLILKPSIQ